MRVNWPLRGSWCSPQFPITSACSHAQASQHLRLHLPGCKMKLFYDYETAEIEDQTVREGTKSFAWDQARAAVRTSLFLSIPRREILCCLLAGVLIDEALKTLDALSIWTKSGWFRKVPAKGDCCSQGVLLFPNQPVGTVAAESWHLVLSLFPHSVDVPG